MVTNPEQGCLVGSLPSAFGILGCSPFGGRNQRAGALCGRGGRADVWGHRAGDSRVG